MFLPSFHDVWDMLLNVASPLRGRAVVLLTSAVAQGNPQDIKGEIDPGAVSDGLKAIFSHSSRQQEHARSAQCQHRHMS